MPYNGSGSFSAPSASFPAVSGALIESAKFNNIVNDIASGLSTAIAKDGQTTITADLPMSGRKHTGVGNAVSRTDYAAAGQVQDSSMTWAGTAGGTANAITLTLTPALAAYAAGQSFTYKSGATANTSTMTVNVNGLGAKAIQKNGAALSAGDHPAGGWFRITYDGVAFQLEKIGGSHALLKGTSENDEADAGYVGQYTSSTVLAASALALTTGTEKNVTSISLTAGDWDVYGNVLFSFAASTQVAQTSGSISISSALLDPTSRSSVIYPASMVPGVVTKLGVPCPESRISISSTTTVYLVAYADFSVSTCSAYGRIWARRAR